MCKQVEVRKNIILKIDFDQASSSSQAINLDFIPDEMKVKYSLYGQDEQLRELSNHIFLRKLILRELQKTGQYLNMRVMPILSQILVWFIPILLMTT